MDHLDLALESRAFELAFERTYRHVQVVCDAERLRQLRVHQFLLEKDNDDLDLRVNQYDGRIDRLQRLNEELQENLQVCAGNLESAHGQIRIKSREVGTLKVGTK